MKAEDVHKYVLIGPGHPWFHPDHKIVHTIGVTTMHHDVMAQDRHGTRYSKEGHVVSIYHPGLTPDHHAPVVEVYQRSPDGKPYIANHQYRDGMAWTAEATAKNQAIVSHAMKIAHDLAQKHVHRAAAMSKATPTDVLHKLKNHPDHVTQVWAKARLGEDL